MDAKKVASEIDVEIRALPHRNIPSVRAVRRKYSQMLKQTSAVFMLELARTLFKEYGYRWVTYELIQNHHAAFRCIGEAELENSARASTVGGRWTPLRVRSPGQPGWVDRRPTS
jgi:hypothetical protein